MLGTARDDFASLPVRHSALDVGARAALAGRLKVGGVALVGAGEQLVGGALRVLSAHAISVPPDSSAVRSAAGRAYQRRGGGVGEKPPAAVRHQRRRRVTESVGRHGQAVPDSAVPAAA